MSDNKKIKIYIAGLIGETEESVYMQKFEKAKQECIQLGFETVLPTELPHKHKRGWTDFMREDLIAMLQDCEYVYAISDWRKSTGARIEVELALQLGFNIIQQGSVIKNVNNYEI